MEIITNWRARRAGGRITVTGTLRDGERIKVTGVDMIEVEGLQITATVCDGRKYRLTL